MANDRQQVDDPVVSEDGIRSRIVQQQEPRQEDADGGAIKKRMKADVVDQQTSKKRATVALIEETTQGEDDRPLLQPNGEPVTAEYLENLRKQRRKTRDKRVYRNVAFKALTFAVLLVLALVGKWFQAFMETKNCARLFVEDGLLVLQVERIKDPDSDLCMDEHETFIVNVSTYDGPVQQGNPLVLKKILEGIDEPDFTLNGIGVAKCLRTILSKENSMESCMVGNAAQGVALCHGKRETSMWPHKSMEKIYHDHSVKSWLHIDIDPKSDPDIVADIANTKLTLAKTYKVVYSVKCPLHIFRNGTETIGNLKRMLEGDLGSRTSSNSKGYYSEERLRDLLAINKDEQTGGQLSPRISQKNRLLLDNLFWTAWRYDFDVVSWVRNEFGPDYALFKFNILSTELSLFDETWWKKKKLEMTTKTHNKDKALADELMHEWDRCIDGDCGAAIVYIGDEKGD